MRLINKNSDRIPYLAIIWYNLPYGEFKKMKQTYSVHYNQNLDKEQSMELEICVEEVGECSCIQTYEIWKSRIRVRTLSLLPMQVG